MGSLAISAPRGGPAPLRHRGDSFPRIMAVGGVFLIFEVIRTASGPGAESTGETSGTEPESGRRRSDAAAVRQSMRRRHRRAPRRLEPPCGPRGWRGSRGQEWSAPWRCAAPGRRRAAVNGPPSRHRRDTCDGAPRLSGWQAAMGASCFASGEALDRGVVGIASWPRRDVLQAPLWLSGDRCGSLARLHSAAVCSQC